MYECATTDLPRREASIMWSQGSNLNIMKKKNSIYIFYPYAPFIKFAMVADRQNSPTINRNVQPSIQQPQPQYDCYLKLDITR